jgi:hypothetical protein
MVFGPAVAGSHKLPLKSYLAAIAIFCDEVKGKTALTMSRGRQRSRRCAPMGTKAG